MDKIEIILEPVDNSRLLNLCGPLNNNIKEIELRFDVEINQRGNLFNFVGIKKNITIASQVVKDLYLKAENNNISQNVLRNYLHQPDVLDEKIISVDNSHETIRFFNFKNYKIKLENYSQQVFYQSILKDDLVFFIFCARPATMVLAIAAALRVCE